MTEESIRMSRVADNMTAHFARKAKIEREYEARKIALGHAVALAAQLVSRWDSDIVSTANTLLAFLLEDLPEETSAVVEAAKPAYRYPAPTPDDEIPF